MTKQFVDIEVEKDYSIIVLERDQRQLLKTIELIMKGNGRGHLRKENKKAFDEIKLRLLSLERTLEILNSHGLS